jgi:hypothetical protein
MLVLFEVCHLPINWRNWIADVALYADCAGSFGWLRPFRDDAATARHSGYAGFKV